MYKLSMPSLLYLPSMNEERNYSYLYESQYIFKKYGIEEIIVADNSSDRTAEIAASMGAKS